jgi:hypothetical protein
MSGHRLIVVESNEVSSHTFRWYATQHPAGAIARLLWEGALHSTGVGPSVVTTPYWHLSAGAGRSVVTVGADFPALAGQSALQRLIRTLDDGAALRPRGVTACARAR